MLISENCCLCFFIFIFCFLVIMFIFLSFFLGISIFKVSFLYDSEVQASLGGHATKVQQ